MSPRTVYICPNCETEIDSIMRHEYTEFALNSFGPWLVGSPKSYYECPFCLYQMPSLNEAVVVMTEEEYRQSLKQFIPEDFIAKPKTMTYINKEVVDDLS